MKYLPANFHFGVVGLILLITFLTYFPVLNYGFLNWDDDIHVTNNPSIKSFDLQSVKETFQGSDRYMYHPITMISYMVDWWAGDGNPAVFHGTNILLHIFNTMLVFTILRTVISSRLIVICITLIFALHPMSVETVAWISSRKDVLSAFFFLSSILILIYTQSQKSKVLIFSSTILFVLSLFSKPTFIAFPFIIVIYIWIVEKERLNEKIGAVIPMLVSSMSFALFFLLQGNNSLGSPIELYPFLERITLFLYPYVQYPLLYLHPSLLSASYPYPQLFNGTFTSWHYLSAVISLTIMGVIIYFRMSVPKRMVLFILLYVGTIVPTTQLIPYQNASLMADRYFYIPQIFLLLVWYEMIQWINIRSIKVKLPIEILSFCVILFLGYTYSQTLTRISVWKDSITLFTDVIRKYPEAAIAYGNRAMAYAEMNRYDDAVNDLYKMAERVPSNGKVYYHIGSLLNMKGRYDEAIQYFKKAKENGYSNAHLFYSTALAFENLSEKDSADAYYTLSYRSDTTFIPAVHAEAQLSLERGDENAAQRLFLQSAQDSIARSSSLHFLYSIAFRNDDIVKMIEYAAELRNENLHSNSDSLFSFVNAHIKKQSGMRRHQ